MTQLGIDFEWMAAHRESQRVHLARVHSRIADHVLSFAAHRLAIGVPEFHLEELLLWVRDRAGVAPESPGRILRALRREGRVRYELLDRGASRYRITGVRP